MSRRKIGKRRLAALAEQLEEDALRQARLKEKGRQIVARWKAAQEAPMAMNQG